MAREPDDPAAHSNGQIILTGSGVYLGIRRLFVLALFAIPFGIAFGATAVEKGMPVYQIIVMSILIFSGMAQFSSMDFWRDPIAFGTLAFVILAVNARHVVMGAALSPWVNRLPPRQKLLAMSFMSDLNFADTQPALKSGERDVGILLGGGLILWVNWIIGTVVGVFAGSLIGNPAVYGMDVVILCFFAATIMGQMEDMASALAAGIAACIAVLSLEWLPFGWNVVVAGLIGGVAGAVFHAE